MTFYRYPALQALLFSFSLYLAAVVLGQQHPPAMDIDNNAGEPFMSLYWLPSDQPISGIIPPDFASLSFEWSEAQKLGNSQTVRTLIKYLKNTVTGQGINIRVGGNSADETWWDDDLTKNKTASCSESYDGKHCNNFGMTTDALLALYHMTQDVNGSLILDLTMAQHNSTKWALEEILHILKTAEGFPNNVLEGLEVGNEADLYDRGRRKHDYNVSQFESELDMYMKDIRTALGDSRQRFIRGGGFAYKKEYVNEQRKLMTKYAHDLYSWSYHRYPTLACRGIEPTMSDLLSDAATIGQAKEITRDATFAAAHNLSFHLGETNSAACGGLLGLTDTMASALWALDYMFVMATNNVTRLNFHGGRNAPYSWFWVNETTQEPSVKPLYYAMFVWTWITSGVGTQIFPLHCRGWGCSDGLQATTKHAHVCQNGTMVQNVCLSNACRHSTDDSQACDPGWIRTNERQCLNPTDVGCFVDDDLKGGNTDIRIKAYAMNDADNHYKVILINKSLQPQTVAPKVRVYLPFLDENRGTAKAELSQLKPSGQDHPYDGSTTSLSATQLGFRGWTWTGSKVGERQGQEQTSSQPYPQQDPEDKSYYYEIVVPRAQVIILSIQTTPVEQQS